MCLRNMFNVTCKIRGQLLSLLPLNLLKAKIVNEYSMFQTLLCKRVNTEIPITILKIY